MKKVLSMLIGSLIVLMGGTLIFGSLLPQEFEVSRSIELEADAETVYQYTADLKNWQAWSPWSKLDPNMNIELKGTPGELDSSYHWNGNDDVGSGSMTITSLEAPKKISMDLLFLSPFESKSTIHWQIEDLGEKRKFTWTMNGKNEGVMLRVFAFVSGMEGMIAAQFDEGLDNLKNRLN